jgi:multiple sugar transport system ATP-binding protein
VREPDVFLLDEPLSNLDAQMRVQMRAELKLLQQRLGATMLYVTHDQVEAMTLGTRLAVLRDGAVQQVGAPDEVYGRPANRFVATFVGSPSMNVLPAIVDGDVIRTGRLQVRLRDREAVGDSAVQVGIRPQDVRVLPEGQGVPGIVRVVEPAGAETFLHLEVEGHSLVARVPVDLRPAPESTVGVELPEDCLYVFHRESGQTLVQAK